MEETRIPTLSWATLGNLPTGIKGDSIPSFTTGHKTALPIWLPLRCRTDDDGLSEEGRHLQHVHPLAGGSEKLLGWRII